MTYYSCYYRIDNIEVEAQPATKMEIQMSEILATVPKASHAQLDKIVLDHFPSRHCGRREVLVRRRTNVTSLIEQRIYIAQQSAVNRVRRARFIGPLTDRMANGHPF